MTGRLAVLVLSAAVLVSSIALIDLIDGSEGSGTEYADESGTNTTFTIRFDGNGATGGSMKDQVVESGELFELNKNTFYRTGYSFRGWNTEIDASGTWWIDQATLTTDKDMLLYAQWQGGPEPPTPEPTQENKLHLVIIIIVVIAAVAIALVLYWYHRSTKE